MAVKLNTRLLLVTVIAIFIALLTWTLLFYKNKVLGHVLTDIHLIFLSTLTGYFIIAVLVRQAVLDFIKVFVRTLFRVWLFIFISFAIVRSMDRVGLLLSISFIFGYFEGLLDIDKWLQSGNPLPRLLPAKDSGSRINHALATLSLMSLVHILCAGVILVIYVAMYTI